MSSDSAISRHVLSDQVKDRLLEAILAGEFPPGSRIVETRLAREFGTSQAPVREALRDLEALGVVEIAPFRGARVRRPTRHELVEAFVVRSELESLAARLAVPNMTDAVFEELGESVYAMRRAAADGDTYREATADLHFHSRVIEAAGNATLQRVWRNLEPFSRTLITIAVPGVDRQRIAELHPPVIEALRRGDPDLAAAAIHHHFEEAAAMLATLWMDRGPAEGRPTAKLKARRGQTPAAARPVAVEAS